jgi:hypothetical protein
MRRLALSALLAVIAALILTGCGRASSPPVARRPATPFPAVLPPHTQLAFAQRDAGPVINGARRALFVGGEMLVLTRGRTAYVSCWAGRRMKSLATVTPAVAQRWAALLSRAHLAQMRSDAPVLRGRMLWFLDGGHVVALDFARHVHRAHCVGTECMAALRPDASLQAVELASAAFSAFITSHCPAAQ